MPSYELTACPVCAASRAELVAGPEEVRREVELLWEFHGRRLRPDTPPARLADRVAFSQRPPLGVVRCTACGLVYRNPRERESELTELYRSEAPEESVLAALFENQRRAYRTQASRLTRVLGRTGSGLEVGSYVGAFLAAVRDAGWRFEGTDINTHVNAFARARGAAVIDGDLPSLDPARRYDAIAIWNCFDQLPDPRRTAIAARAHLRDGGVLALRVPNGAFYASTRTHLTGPWRRAARALLAHNNLLTFPYRYGFTPRTLHRLLAAAGFTVQTMYGDALVPIADEWTRPWAAFEERAIKACLRAIARRGTRVAHWTPWLEVYATASHVS